MNAVASTEFVMTYLPNHLPPLSGSEHLPSLPFPPLLSLLSSHLFLSSSFLPSLPPCYSFLEGDKGMDLIALTSTYKGMPEIDIQTTDTS